jgi:hypothetical protein
MGESVSATQGGQGCQGRRLLMKRKTGNVWIQRTPKQVFMRAVYCASKDLRIQHATPSDINSPLLPLIHPPHPVHLLLPSLIKPLHDHTFTHSLTPIPIPTIHTPALFVPPKTSMLPFGSSLRQRPQPHSLIPLHLQSESSLFDTRSRPIIHTAACTARHTAHITHQTTTTRSLRHILPIAARSNERVTLGGHRSTCQIIDTSDIRAAPPDQKGAEERAIGRRNSLPGFLA